MVIGYGLVGKVEVNILAVFGFELLVALLEVAIAKKFAFGRQAEGFFVRQFNLQRVKQLVGSGKPIACSTAIATLLFVDGIACIASYLYGSGYFSSVVFSKS